MKMKSPGIFLLRFPGVLILFAMLIPCMPGSDSPPVAFNLTSLATFLGLVSAGIAVALQNVILSVAGYFC
jgi:hypothetical protein